MNNIWTQHLKRPASHCHKRHASFTRMLHTLVKEKNTSDKLSSNENVHSDRSDSIMSTNADTDYFCTSSVQEIMPNSSEPIELSRWTAKSQRGYEMNSNEYDDDYVQLLKYPDGHLSMKYYVTGEDDFEMEIQSEEEALNIIAEDNTTTSQLYPGRPELQWSEK